MKPLTKGEAETLYHKFVNAETVSPLRQYFKLPKCDYCTRLAHKIWAKLQNHHRYYKNPNFQTLAQMELDGLNLLLEEIGKVDMIGIHLELSKLDKIFETTH